ncbi:MAG: lytic transglycosylase domain-containing protein [Clostridia bacterium]|nr:lytic transglycosylase domain-containing protein [Clostridia bacterium]
MQKAIVVLILLAIFATVAFLCVDDIEKLFYQREFTEFVTKYSNEFDVPEALVYAVIRAESNFDPEARSGVGAIGLMQLMPDTLDWLSRLLDEDNPTGEINDPETNIKYGTYYLRHLYDRFGNWETVLAAYNAGHGRVATWLENPEYSDDGVTLKKIPFEETKNYVNKVNGNYNTYKKLYYKDED